ncbi:MAG: AraC family transcriptional regulator [Prolixibacteraceae bacterium]|jgi:AraC-like DNA-binding protein|nr:AraC family transcriptional regulator [Prolixibacteraceae bacterium]
MQPKLEKVPLHLTSSIYVKREITPYMDYPWHYHPEYEIIFVEKSYGIRLMGNHIGNFSDGDLMFIGSNLPHVWKNDKDFYQENKDLMVDVYVIQFCENALGDGFFDLPEFIHIKKLFNLGQQGLVVNGDKKGEIAALIKEVYHATGIERLVQFFRTLDTIANNTEYELLSSIGYANSITNIDTERINKIMSFLMEHYKQDVDMDEIAALVNLNQSSFCRYFKSKTHKTCSQFLNEIRIAHACKLLINSNLSISEICYETGYNNISHFNRQFKLITSLTASGYAKKYLKNANLV